MEPLGWRMVLEIAAPVHTAHPLKEIGGRVNNHSQALIVGYEVGMSAAECLSGLHTRMRIILVGCRTLIAVDASRDRMRAGAGCLTVPDCEDREVGIVAAAAAEMVVLDRHMRTVAVHFEVDTVALECESLSS